MNNQKNQVIERTLGTNWNDNNIKTLITWNSIAAFNIEALEDSIILYQSIIRWNIILGLIMSTTSGALSATRFGFESNVLLGLIFNSLFTFMAFSITIFTGGIKVYQIQEKLEKFIKVKQEWINFSLTIASEFQLPLYERQDALLLIKKHKSKYLDLLKIDNEIPPKIKKNVTKRLNKWNKDNYNNEMKIYTVDKLSEVIYEINNDVKRDKELYNLTELQNDITIIKMDILDKIPNSYFDKHEYIELTDDYLYCISIDDLKKIKLDILMLKKKLWKEFKINDINNLELGYNKNYNHEIYNNYEPSHNSDPENNSEPITANNSEPLVANNTEPLVVNNSEPITSNNSEPIVSNNSEPLASNNSEPITANNSEPIIDNNIELIVANNSEPIIDNNIELIVANNSEPIIDNNSEPIASNTNN